MTGHENTHDACAAQIVRIKDKWLAVLHYVFMLLIFLYIVVYTIIMKKAYYDIEAPVGTVRINPMAPSEWTNASDLPYCRLGNRTELYGYNLSKCLYYDEALDVFPQALDQSVMLATRIKRSFEEPTNPEFNDSTSAWKPTSQDYIYLADIDRFTVCNSAKKKKKKE